MATIRDVAKQLNLSITTVSRALDGYDDVAENTRQLVIQTARAMGYVPNRAARQLRRQRSDTIGYILPASAPQFSDPFFAEFITGLGDQASSQNFDLLVSTASPASETEQSAYQRWAHGRKVDGVILNRMRLYDWRVQFLHQVKLPFVSLERSLDPIDYPCIEVDGASGFEKMLDCLVQIGHRRIAYVSGPPDLKTQSDRLTGYRQGLENAGIPFDPGLVMSGDTTRTGGYQAAKILLGLPDPPTAISCFNDLTAIGVLHAANELGLKVGRDLAVTGFDGIADSEHTLPPLTTLDQPLYEIARQLVTMLIAQINGEFLAEQCVRFQPQLILRQSTSREEDGPIYQH